MSHRKAYQPRTGRRKVFVAVRLDEPLAMRLRALAIERRVSFGSVVATAVRKEVKYAEQSRA